jgi:SNF2 family DNA or RNA helicase
VKHDVLEDIIEEAAGEPVLVFYKFKAELEALQARFPQGEALLRNSKPDVIERWNKNAIPVLFANPLSAGHGINLQLGGAHIMVWLALESSPEIYQQAVGRLYRQGQSNDSVIIHHINVTDSDNLVDDDIRDMLAGRVRVQQLMLKRLSLLQQGRASLPPHASWQASSAP